jgi:hypothetical protein
MNPDLSAFTGESRGVVKTFAKIPNVNICAKIIVVVVVAT